MSKSGILIEAPARNPWTNPNVQKGVSAGRSPDYPNVNNRFSAYQSVSPYNFYAFQSVIRRQPATLILTIPNQLAGRDDIFSSTTVATTTTMATVATMATADSTVSATSPVPAQNQSCRSVVILSRADFTRIQATGLFELKTGACFRLTD
jgi:hypothetical protein